jgi:hypothetical protein
MGKNDSCSFLLKNVCKKNHKETSPNKHKVKKKKYSNPSTEDITNRRGLEYFDYLGEFDISFKIACEPISEIFRKYSVKDIATTLFVSSLWLPNVASGIKQQLLVSIFASMKPRCFSKKNRISTYSDFGELLKQIHLLLPNFPMLEDYVPEPDWGQVKFFHNGEIYKIFYGQELSNVYDYLVLFQMLYAPLDKEYKRVSGRSPVSELQNCLILQDEIISGISSQAKDNALSELKPGYLEIPPKYFWESAVEFYTNFDVKKRFDHSFLENYSLHLGNWASEHLEFENFAEIAFQGKVVPKFFIVDEDQYFPILPRRYSSILFDSWSAIYEINHKNVVENNVPYSFYIGKELYRYINARINCNFLKPLVSAILKDDQPHEVIFPTAFISKDRFILIYVTNPAYSGKEIEKELEDVTPQLCKAMDLINASPLTLALRLEKAKIQFTESQDLKPELFVVIPQTKTELSSISVPRALPGEIIFLDAFIGIVDELDDKEMFASFLEYLEEYGALIRPSLISPLDIFSSFKDSFGVLVEGADEYNHIFIDPHWGSILRYKTLSDFWKVYPEVHFFDHPRSWRVRKETETRVRLEARGYLGTVLYCVIGKTHIFLNAPFDNMNAEQASLANLLMECLEDSLSTNKALLEKHQFLKTYDQLQILFFPHSLVQNNEQFKHLEHLNPGEEYWRSDCGFPAKAFAAIRLVFNDKLLPQVFKETKDRSIEIELLCQILSQINRISPCTGIDSMMESLEVQKTSKPRFTLFTTKKNVSFPEFVNPHKPERKHFKRARQRIAKLAKQYGLSEGYYELEDAKAKLNALRDTLIAEVNLEVQKYHYFETIPYLLTRIDALTNDNERSTFTIEYSKKLEVDYDRAEKYAEQHLQYITMHKNYRYLIEKFVQLEPSGEKTLDKDAFQYLISLVDWLHVFYSASDSLQYAISPLGVYMDKNLIVNVKYGSDMEEKQKLFGEEHANLVLGYSSRDEDKVCSPRPIQDLLYVLDEAFKKDFHFKFSNMINTLQVLANWAEYQDIEMSSFYSADVAQIEKSCLQCIDGIAREEVDLILKFLTLRKEDVLRITGQNERCADLPVWEHRKRFARYNLRPLLLIEDRYYWGPYSAMKAGIIWSGNLSYGKLPIDLQSPKVQEVVESEKRLIENSIEEKAFEIVKRYTKYVRKNCELHQVNSSHPQDLGDYDVLSFIPGKNIILNIECKDNLPAFCLKDAKRLREKIFGRPGKDLGHFEHIEKRRIYLAEHISSIAKDISWPINVDTRPEIVTIYLTRFKNWWTSYPPIDVNAVFLRVDMLANYIEGLWDYDE